jgi:hypothetical protein
VAPERTPSTDDERSASSYSILDRRHYRAESSSTPNQIDPVPFAIGLRLDVNEDEDATAIGEATAVNNPYPRNLSNLAPQDEGNERVTQRRKKRKYIPKFGGSETNMKKHHKKDDHDDPDSHKPPRSFMSGRRHSGLRYSA